jgi:dienelactone hydrolase
MPFSTRARALATSFCTVCTLLGPLAQAASPADVQLIYDGVRSKFPDFSAFCKMGDAERRQATVQVTMALMNTKKFADPFSAGTMAGAQLRKDCGLDAAATGPASIRWTANAKPLQFSAERHGLGLLSSAASLSNRIHAPEGPGPFPAVVLNHTIGGVSQHLLAQAKALLEAGYAVLLVDSYGPRDLRPGSLLFPAEVAKDAYDALAHLEQQRYLDKTRIFQAGYSLGAMASALLASPEGAQAFKSNARFRATVGHYGSCAVQTQPSAAKLEMLTADSDRPVLMLMAELDIETPPASCFPLLEQMKASGKDVQWHIYPNATHGWDKAENHGYVYRSASGAAMTYRYDPAVTQDATGRMIAFFNRFR